MLTRERTNKNSVRNIAYLLSLFDPQWERCIVYRSCLHLRKPGVELDYYHRQTYDHANVPGMPDRLT